MSKAKLDIDEETLKVSDNVKKVVTKVKKEPVLKEEKPVIIEEYSDNHLKTIGTYIIIAFIIVASLLLFFKINKKNEIPVSDNPVVDDFSTTKVTPNNTTTVALRATHTTN